MVTGTRETPRSLNSWAAIHDPPRPATITWSNVPVGRETSAAARMPSLNCCGDAVMMSSMCDGSRGCGIEVVCYGIKRVTAVWTSTHVLFPYTTLAPWRIVRKAGAGRQASFLGQCRVLHTY